MKHVCVAAKIGADAKDGAGHIAAAVTRLPQARLREQPHKPRDTIAFTRRFASLPAPRCARPSPGRMVKPVDKVSAGFGCNPLGWREFWPMTLSLPLPIFAILAAGRFAS